MPRELASTRRSLEERLAWLVGPEDDNGAFGAVRKQVDDHELRLRSIEKAVYKASAIAGIVAAVAAVALQYIANHL